LLALVLTTAENFATGLLTRKLGSLTYVTRRSLRLLATVTRNLYVDITRRTCSRVAQNVTDFVLTVFVFLFVAGLSATVRQNKRIILRLAEPATKTKVDR